MLVWSLRGLVKDGDIKTVLGADDIGEGDELDQGHGT